MMGKASKQRNEKSNHPTPKSMEQTPILEQVRSLVDQKASKSISIFDAQKILNLLVLAAAYGPLSQSTLAPVYGSIPSATYHNYILLSSTLLAFTVRDVLPIWTAKIISPMAYWIPSLQFLLFQYSNQLDQFGPLVTELLTTFPLITLTVQTAMRIIDDIDLRYLGSSEAGPPLVVYFSFLMLHRLMKNVIPMIMGWNIVCSRVGLQLAIATLYGLILPQSLLWPALPSVIFTVVANPRLPLQRNTDIANNTLSLYNYTLLERRESVTGYLSVLQDDYQKFRVMRCDHSLLGGEWQFPTAPGVYRPVGETIYPVFTMLEAVRLVEPPSASADNPAIPKSDAEKRALTIGLGTGSAPSAFIAHGINTTILELDPVVHYFASKYFNLPKNHSYYIGDAVDYVYSAAAKLQSVSAAEDHSQSVSKPYPENVVGLQYDYILHDTFTGGALPIPLFTHSFLKSLSSLLKPTGVIAINYAGDLDLPSASLVYRTITSVFSNRCRIFREDVEQPKPGKQKEKGKTTRKNQNQQKEKKKEEEDNDKYHYEGDFTNLVYFCLPPDAPMHHKIHFRKPIEADFLGSGARRHYMMPKHELNQTEQRMKFGDDGKDKAVFPRVLEMSDGKSVRVVEKYQARSAFGHWKLMRTVIRPEIWEVW